jgi:hypothetical protein
MRCDSKCGTVIYHFKLHATRLAEHENDTASKS